MAKPNNSQWDFGELFPVETKNPKKEEAVVALAAAPARQVLTVGELTGQVRRLLEKQVGQIWVTGEITNFRSQSSGHFYFTLKDADSQLSCVLFRDEARGSRALLQDGRHVVLQGTLTVYEPRGQYQLRVTAVELQGIGALQAAFEKLKARLNVEGLFAAERKRPLPRYPVRIGLVTSLTGAAIRDVLHVIQRRHPGLEIIVAHCRVQGPSAAEEIAAALRSLNEFHKREISGEGRLNDMARPIDLVLVTRGGGSLEDLWAFNEEVVARAIFESGLPVVSAVGHEIDFSISDFVADFRAATPSAAAEIISEGFYSSREFVLAAEERLRQLVVQQWQDKFAALSQARQRLARRQPRRVINEALQRLDDLRGSLLRRVRQTVGGCQRSGQNLIERLKRLNPLQEIKRRRDHLEQLQESFQEEFKSQVRQKRHQLATLEMRLRLLGPEQVLARGYSITRRESDGKIVRAANEVRPGEKLRTRLQSGEIRSVIRDD